MDRLRSLYDSYLDNGDLLEVFPELRRKSKENNWELDKEKFIKLNKDFEQATHLDLHLDEE